MAELNLYLIRHGRTEWNIQGRLQGSGDSPLIAIGVENAKRTGALLADVPFVACYSSLLKRAQDTADYIIGSRAIPHFHHRGLNEIHFGLWEGRIADELRELEEFQQMKTQPAHYRALSNQGETMEQLYVRSKRAFDEIVANHPNGGNILIVSHGMTLTILIATLRNVHWHDFRDETKQPFIRNTAINMVSVQNGQIEVKMMNKHDHLLEDR